MYSSCSPVFRLPGIILPPHGGDEAPRGAVHVGGVDGHVAAGEIDQALCGGRVRGSPGGPDGGAADEEEAAVEADANQVLRITLDRPAQQMGQIHATCDPLSLEIGFCLLNL